jgi:hypothetical protein
MCHELAKMAVEVPLLVLLDTPHPYVIDPNPLSDMPALKRWCLRVVELWKARSSIQNAQRILESQARVPVELRTEYIVATYDWAIRRYQPPKVRADAMLFRAIKNFVEIPDLGWSAGLEGKFDIVDVPGDHLAVVRDTADIEIIGRELAKRMSSLRLTRVVAAT